MTSLVITRSTPFCTVQDAGRFGIRHLGITQSGAADWVSMYWANWLLGNLLTAPVVEIPLGGFAVKASGISTVAIAGANLGAQLNGAPLGNYQTVELKEGDELTFLSPVCGQRAYLAAPGGFLATNELGSVSTNSREQLGGLNGSGVALGAGDTLNSAAGIASLRVMPAAKKWTFEARAVLDMVIGAQLGQFTGRSTFDAFNSDWEIDARADRMGIRLQGPILDYLGAPLISEGIPYGAIQVPPDGQPIVLLNDRQTIGGYPRIGALTPIAAARIAQLAPGDKVRLRPTTQESAAKQHLEILASYWGWS